MSLMVDRLELCAKEVGLKFTAGHPDGSIFIGSDMFYVEVRLEASSGKVKDVMITQGADTVVRRNNFDTVAVVIVRTSMYCNTVSTRIAPNVPSLSPFLT